MSEPVPIRIDLFSDPICPWCFIGKRRLEKALAARPDMAATVYWRPFQLNPDMPAEGMDRQSYLEAKFGGPERAKRIYEPIGIAGASVGIDFAFDQIKVTPNTVAAHLLIRFAQDGDSLDPTVPDRPFDVGRRDAVLDGLFHTYFLEGRNIGEIPVLLEIAEAAGLDASAFQQYLDAGIERSDVIREDSAARRLGIGGVPCFIIDRAYAVSGAQEPETFFPLFDLARQQLREAAE